MKSENNENQKKRKRKFASLDAFILVLAAVGAALLCFRVFIGEELFFNETGSNTESGEYTVYFRPASDRDEMKELFSENDIQPGSDIYLSSGEILGKVVYADSFGASVEASGVMSDSGFLLNGTLFLAANMTVDISISDKTAAVQITDIAENK